MLLQSLVMLYETLAKEGKADKSGWAKVKTAYGVCLNENGELTSILSLKVRDKANKKDIPQEISLPMHAKRSANVLPNYLCDTGSYVLGFDTKSKEGKAKKCFEECKRLHLELLTHTDTPAAQAIKRFFQSWNPENTESVLDALCCTENVKKDILQKGENLLLMPFSKFPSVYPELGEAWDSSYRSKGEDKKICLITGKKLPVAVLHPSIQGVRGAQSSGASLVSFNAPSFESFEKKQGYNAPVSAYAAFAYTTALNYLLAQRDYVRVAGDTTIVCWTEDNNTACSNILMDMLGGSENILNDDTLWSVVRNLANGKSVDWEGIPVHPDNHFYILGLSPNAARISVRFFLENTFGGFMRNVILHENDMEIVRPVYDKREHLSIWSLLNETVNPKSQNKAAKPQLAGDMIRSVLTGEKYPATLYNNVMIRIKAEQKISRGKAAAIKAYLRRNYKTTICEEALQVELNENCTYQPYVLGRLFALLEEIQSAANPGINTTITDKYFTSASATPALVFPLLNDLAKKHMRKMKDTGKKIFYQQQMTKIMSLLKEAYPARLSLPDKGVFQIGYYHQNCKRFTKKEEE